MPHSGKQRRAKLYGQPAPGRQQCRRTNQGAQQAWPPSAYQEHRVARARVHLSDKTSLRKLKTGHPLSAARQRRWNVNLPVLRDHTHESCSHGSNVVRWPGYDPFHCGNAISCVAVRHVQLSCQRMNLRGRQGWNDPGSALPLGWGTSVPSKSSPRRTSAEWSANRKLSLRRAARV